MVGATGADRVVKPGMAAKTKKSVPALAGSAQRWGPPQAVLFPFVDWIYSASRGIAIDG